MVADGRRRFEGRVVVVTGGGSGLGEAMCHAFAREGGRVAAVDINEQAARKVADASEGEAKGYVCDVADPAAVRETFASVDSDLGPVEVLVNNAGITRDGTMHKMSFEQWNAVIQTNLASCFNMCRCVIEGMRAMIFSSTLGGTARTMSVSI